MLRTITIGSTLQIQGVPVGLTPDGRLMVRDGDRVFAGQPVPKWPESAPRMQPVPGPKRDRKKLDAS